jgi:hypothetical protein
MLVRFTPPSRAAHLPTFEAIPTLVDETPTERIYSMTGYMVTGPRPQDRIKVSEGYELRVPKAEVSA